NRLALRGREQPVKAAEDMEHGGCSRECPETPGVGRIAPADRLKPGAPDPLPRGAGIEARELLGDGRGVPTADGRDQIVVVVDGERVADVATDRLEVGREPLEEPGTGETPVAGAPGGPLRSVETHAASAS